MLSKPLIHQLQEIWIDEFSIELTEAEASSIGSALVNYFEILQKAAIYNESFDC